MPSPSISRSSGVPLSSLACAALLVAAVFGFWLPYFSRLSVADRFTHSHAATMVVWMLLLVGQPLLIRHGQLSLHRWAGRASKYLVPLILVCSLLLAHARISQPGALDQPGALQLLVLQCCSPLLFAGFYLAGLRNRQDRSVHSRWMLATGILLIDPIVARVLAFWLPHWSDAGEWAGPLLAGLVLAGLMLVERREQSARHVYPLVLAWMTLQLVLFYSLGATTLWRSFAAWFAALPLT